MALHLCRVAPAAIMFLLALAAWNGQAVGNTADVNDAAVHAPGPEAHPSHSPIRTIFHQAVLWKNGEEQVLSDPDNDAYASSVFVSGRDVYVAGYESLPEYTTGRDGRQYLTSYRETATIWKNGQPQRLDSETSHAQADSVFVSGKDVYVAGYYKNGGPWIAVLWKNGVAQKLTDPIKPQTLYYISKDGRTSRRTVPWLKRGNPQSIHVSGGDFYVVGTAQTRFGSSQWGQQWRHIPILWKNGIAHTFVDTDIEPGNSIRDTYDTLLSVSGKDVYVAGWESGSSEQRVVRVWKWSSGSHMLVHDYSVSGQRGATVSRLKSIQLSGTDIYVLGTMEEKTNTQLGVASYTTLWKNGVPQKLDRGYPISLFASGKDLYALTSMYIWKNGKRYARTHISNSSIFVSGKDVYVAGYKEGKITTWGG